MNIFKAANFFYKFAIDYPDWIPEKHKRKLDKIDSIQKDPRLVDFKVPVEHRLNIPTSNEKELMPAIRYNFSLIKTLNSSEYTDIIKEIDKNDKTVEELKKLTSLAIDFSDKVCIESYFIKVLRDNNIKIGTADLTFSKFYNKTISKYIKILERYKNIEKYKDIFRHVLAPKMFEDIPGYKDWMNRINEKKIDDGLQFVFTTKHFDILGMSSRSEWKSCQDLRPGSTWLTSDFNLGTLGSCVSKNIGIIYITDGSDYEGRGEKMIYRSSVWIVKDMDTDEDVLFVQRVYPDYSAVVKEGFKNILKEKLGMEIVINGADLIKYYEDYEHKAYDDADLSVKGGENCCICNGALNDQNIVEYANDLYCESCFAASYSYCENCNGARENDEIVLVRDYEYDEYYYCIDCAKRKGYSKCDKCDKFIKDEMTVDCENYCPNCFENDCFVCKDCEEPFLKKDVCPVIDKSGDTIKQVCKGCIDDYEECLCNKYLDEEDANKVHLLRDNNIIFKYVCDECTETEDSIDQCNECGLLYKIEEPDIEKWKSSNNICYACNPELYQTTAI
ncbi:MAG: hypothetical protein ACOYMA_00600 [Bacteroidia bacterium]